MVSDLINGSLRLLGVLSPGEVPTATEQNDALSVLDDLMDSWSTENLLIPSKLREVFTLVPGQQTYAFGTGGDFNSVRPQLIEDALIVASNSPEIELPMSIVNQDYFSSILVKSTTSTIPLYLYNDNAYPSANINLWPVPSVAAQIVLYSWKPLTNFSTSGVFTTIELPPGYQRMMRYNLAVELGPEYGKEPSPTVVALAVQSKENIKRMNTKELLLGMDQALLNNGKGSFNWITGDTV